MPIDSPLGVGDAAPDFALAVADGDAATLSDFRGDSVLLVLASPHWDPACEMLAAQYPGAPGAPRPRVITERRPEIASHFGVRGRTALYVIDERGVIRWRYVAGVDGIPQSSVDAEGRSLDALRSLGMTAESPRSIGMTVTRRDFVQSAMMAAAALAATTLVPSAAAAAPALSEPASDSSLAGTTSITLNVNGRPIALEVEPRVTLLDALRERAGLTGTKKGCDHGQCGACTVHIDGRRVLSCLTLAVMVPDGARVTTIEGLAQGDTLHPMQQAFIAHDGFQCGYCTSGQIMSATAMVKEPWGPADDDVREAMSGNLCRCGAYPGIVAAVQSVRSTRSAEAPR
jgi:xanthine dehydrogenase YagT iron-sulfur-binding subunit